MNQRIKELRKALGYTMEKFGANIGVGRSAISMVEGGMNNVSEQLINSICKSDWDGKRVNESWLRTGEGEMFLKMDVEEEIAELIKKIPNEPRGSFKRRLLATLAGLTEDQWVLLADIAEKLAEEKEDDE